MRSGKPGRFFFIPKGALTHHLVGTDSISLALPFGRAHSFRCSSSPQKVLRLSVAPFGGGISVGNRALSEGNAASAEA